ncbi:MAG: phospho-N-acetylmuramoyl-pentapeptide-transferase [Cyclobacteriaceae bacterium]|jgi:phospho-N-acetylmuramoyl-pentapeptide-transferase|nr:phospho-N-acetylmuramoyl-pentapeptide-transferase [Cyclobacteriaceae bacterium]MDB4316438.1 phospho-N-acetylmuramoyl-pentapeptide-transferase [Cyclobacteriaceae bacterium]MDB4602936.1 phospho-N-acetylmuramoyl-pentapeptide-transferase [Cyclobacteriaceae bacterium]MDB4742247.1 phospho-N-acetylmuramoyl-pentapeptide-transferase [Cyclobacteriaceae bacterium]MDB9883714.1 phospho-N-acetylmuramoyl-pentapeptide-transferase [Cyclobacteriaceae bacterium]|tara:strand:- start:1117 stop:2304 length:1188 start_codon:yes stop_codon:yes gene_type:complete
MLYHFFDYIDQEFDLFGVGVFQYISFRAGLAVLISLLITITFGQRLINLLKAFQLGESIRDLGLSGQMEKQGTPTMGGIIILLGIIIPTLLFADLTNIYILLLIISAIWMGAIGFIDDFLKIKKKNKDGLRGKFKIIGQVGLGLLVGGTMVFHPDIVVREFNSNDISLYSDIKSSATTIPFFKNNEFQYSWLLPDFLSEYAWVVYVLMVTFIVTAVSNGVNITDGIDGLAAGTTAIIALSLAILAYLSGNVIFSNYLNIMYIPNSGELVIFCAALVGACIGFLWYNAFPAQVFMGDTGSLALGGIVAVLALAIRKELLIPLLCGIYFIELLSVIIQVGYFKYTKSKFGEGQRVFLMSPIHHHFQKKGLHESKIVTRFWTVGILLAVLTLATLKLR